MSVELVTGYSGVGENDEPKRHVSSAEDGARQAGTVGLGSYVLSTGSKLSATMEDANTLVVADGDAIMNGRHVSLPDPTSFTIPTGVQGQKVSNLAVLRYEKAADSVESVTPLVLTGEPSTGTPTDPTYSEGSILDGDSPVDFPLYRVVTDGINAGDPEPLFSVMMPMSDLWDSVSRSGWDYLYNASEHFYCRYMRSGAMVVLEWAVDQTSDGYWKAGSLPAWARPPKSLYLPACSTRAEGFVNDAPAFCYIGSSGEVGFQTAVSVPAGSRNCGIASWPIS